MQISEQWLREWVNPPVATDELAKRLTMAGLEVSGIAPAAAAFDGVVVGHVRAAAPHPDATHLTVCRVFDGNGEQQVVCGASNVRAGMYTAYARVGAVLADGKSIDRAKLRGVESFGMLCSAAELGIGDDDAGIMTLPQDLRAGASLREALKLDDTILDIELTPNRGDCLSVRGVARELGVLFNLPVTAPACAAVAPSIDDVFPVALEQPDGCPRYLGRVLRGIDVTAQTPLWMQERLRRGGLRSIDPVVDVTNYVMLELGEPLHAFDLALLKQQIVVRNARAGEVLVLLDGRNVTLDAQTLLITDASGPIAIAGVMGGERSGIQSDTRDVFIECAYFAPLAVAGTARRYGLQTDASQRYERGVDHQLQQQAIERATALLIEIVGGTPGPVVATESRADLPSPPKIRLRRARLELYLGESADEAEATRILQRLEFEPSVSGDDETGVRWTITVPSHRFDIEREVDLIEEICRIRGYDRIPSRMPVTRLELGRAPLEVTPRNKLRQVLADLGYNEAVTYSFIDPLFADLLAPGAASVSLTNPMSGELSVMRRGLWPGLLKATLANMSRQQSRVRLFEIGLCFQPGDALTQPMLLGGALTGPRQPENWANSSDAVNFFDLKGDVERILEAGGHHAPTFESANDPILHPGQSAIVWSEGQRVGRLGQLHPELAHRLDIKAPVFLFELDAEVLVARPRSTYRPVSRYPSVRRDISLILGAEIPAAAVRSCVGQALGAALVNFTLFDLYQGEGIDSNKKSIAIGLTLQDHSRTLTDVDINGLMDAAVSALETDLGARRR